MLCNVMYCYLMLCNVIYSSNITSQYLVGVGRCVWCVMRVCVCVRSVALFRLGNVICNVL